MFGGPGRIIAAETIEVQGKGVVNLCSIIVDEKYIPESKSKAVPEELLED